jgi:pyridoxine 5-phosphate synthase
MTSPLPYSLPLRLGVNIDHVATLRNARGGVMPDPVRAALLAIEAGADSITAHLREDRRHIRDADIALLRQHLTRPLNLEMAPTHEMVAIALTVKPHACCLVPEKREERTTEGGLDVRADRAHLRQVVTTLAGAGIRVSLFIEPAITMVDAAVELGAAAVELHTGTWCEALGRGDKTRSGHEYERLRGAAARAAAHGIECHAGHGLDYASAEAIAAIDQIIELNIGHFMMGEALFCGLPAVIGQMRAAMVAGRKGADGPDGRKGPDHQGIGR